MFFSWTWPDNMTKDQDNADNMRTETLWYPEQSCSIAFIYLYIIALKQTFAPHPLCNVKGVLNMFFLFLSCHSRLTNHVHRLAIVSIGIISLLRDVYMLKKKHFSFSIMYHWVFKCLLITMTLHEIAHKMSDLSLRNTFLPSKPSSKSFFSLE